jgi:glycosyltransferase involved in cell wall biosynthesis
MLLSIIIPTFNRNNLLCNCIDRLQPACQRVDNSLYEIIVGDDNPNDTLRGIIAEHYPTVIYNAGPRRGPAANRNAAARQAKGQWLLFIDDDCIPDENLLSSYLKVIKNNNGKILEGCTITDRARKRVDEEAPANSSGGNLWSCNFVIDRNLFLDLGGFDENFRFPYLEDVDFRYRATKKEQITFVQQAVVIHPWRRRPAFEHMGKQVNAHRYFYKKHRERSLKHKFLRFLVFWRESIRLSAQLVRCSFRGFIVYLEKLILYFLLIFC